MRLLVIRHDESQADILGVHEGRADFALTERGRRQAEAMSKYVSAHYDIARIYHSTLKRAVQTAQALAAATGAPLVPEADLMEFDNGLLAGLEYSVARERYPSVPVPLHESVYEQESALRFRYRAEVVLSKLLSEHGENAAIAVVSHGGMINRLYQAFLRLPVDTDLVFQTGDTGIHEWRVAGGKRCVVKANDLAHLG